MHQELLKELSVITEEERVILSENNGIDPQLYTEKKELIVDCEKLLQKGKLIQVRAHTRFVHFPKHRHNYVELIYMCQGSTTHLVDGNEVVLEEGDMLFLNQNAVQEILPAGEKDIAVNFIILPEFFNTAFSMMGGEETALKEFLTGTLCGKNDATSYLYFHVADILPIQNLVENMVWTIFYDTGNKRSSNQITMGLLLLQLLNYMDKMETGGARFDRDLTGNVLSYVEEHYKNGTLSELAEMMGYDIYWLSREIKKRTGKTYKELLQTKRMNQALYLLSSSKLPISDIIESVGYDNNSYFYRKFKERYGMSPKEYREKAPYTCDLHTHTICSDGTDTPVELIDRAAKRGVKVLAMTDHDVVPPEEWDGIHLEHYASAKGIHFLRGMEVSSETEVEDVHLICLGADWSDPYFTELEADVAASRAESYKELVRRLQKDGVDITWEEVLENHGHPVTEEHVLKKMIFECLAEKGQDADWAAAKQRIQSAPRYASARRKPDPVKVIEEVHRCGGIVILAHPYLIAEHVQLDGVDMNRGDYIERLIAAGLDGIEACYTYEKTSYQGTMSRQEVEAEIRSIYGKKGLLISGGSDYHGDWRKGVKNARDVGECGLSEEEFRNIEQILDLASRTHVRSHR